MKIGLYTFDVPASLGGGFVLRDDLAIAAVQIAGRHQFELVTIPAPANIKPPRHHLHKRLRRQWNRTLGRHPEHPVMPPIKRFRNEVTTRKFDLLWFNHLHPIHVGVPYVLNIFDLQHRLQPAFPEVSKDGQWEHREDVWKDAIQRAAIVTVGSEEAKEQLCHFYGVPLENVWVLPFPTPQKAIDIAEGKIDAPARQDVRGKYGIKNDFLFYPAQFWPHKNHVNLLHAVKMLKQRGRAISLVLTGSDHGNLAHVRQTAQDMGVADLVHFCGFVPYEDILTFYHEARALSYVSFFGPENLPPLEAMALECPVILSDIPGVRTLHGDGPVLVDPRKPEAIADSVEYILDNPDQVRDRVKAGKDVALRNNCERYLQNFQRMLDSFEPVRRCWP